MVDRDFGLKVAAVHQKHAPPLGGVALTDTLKQPGQKARLDKSQPPLDKLCRSSWPIPQPFDLEETKLKE
jgi:hypothetical protein